MSRTVVISDLHLGTHSGVDLLRHESARGALMEFLTGAERLVILGDAVELREVPLRAAAQHIADLLADAGRALGRHGEIVMLAGNHDHGLVAGWIETRLNQSEPHSLGLEHRIEPRDAGPLAEQLAGAASPARLTLAYPGIHVREDVYAIHGHYLDLHSTIPTFERLAAGAMARWIHPIPEKGATPDDYETALAPLYAWMHALAQRQRPGAIHAGHGASARAWVTLAHARTRTGRARAAVLGAGYAAAVAAINRIGLGPVRRDLSGPALRQGGLRGMGEMVRRLGIETAHVVFGHTHRGGPWPGDDLSEWAAPTGARLHNTGSWIYQRHFLRSIDSPYWPGSAVVVEASDPPSVVRILPAGWSPRGSG